jgi:hypothetical protein
LRPTAEFCEQFDALVFEIEGNDAAAANVENCIDSQDIPTAFCGCARADGTHDGRIVTTDADVCRPEEP